ncbi:hypothetical protein ECDEC13D_5136 [Escherichia coli DEC13D]|nr:hypothetical protein ECDEC13D_5136 [Escherichia coli DEC13D]
MISLETSASFLGVQNTGASTHRDNKLQLTEPPRVSWRVFYL